MNTNLIKISLLILVSFLAIHAIHAAKGKPFQSLENDVANMETRLTSIESNIETTHSLLETLIAEVQELKSSQITQDNQLELLANSDIAISATQALFDEDLDTLFDEINAINETIDILLAYHDDGPALVDWGKDCGIEIVNQPFNGSTVQEAFDALTPGNTIQGMNFLNDLASAGIITSQEFLDLFYCLFA